MVIRSGIWYMSDLRLVLFDVDGALVDSQAYLTQSILESLAHVGAPTPSPEQMARFHSLSLSGFLKSLDDRLSPEQITATNQYMLAKIHAERASGRTSEHLFPGLVEVLESLEEEGYLLGIVTNKVGTGLELVLKFNKIYDKFVTLNHVDNAPAKPAPDMVLNALKATGVDAVNCLVVGDSQLDMLAARNAGVKALAVTWAGRDEATLREAGADYVIAKVDDLLPAIRKILP